MLEAGIFILILCLVFAFGAQKAAEGVNNNALGALIFILAIPIVLGLFLWGAGLTFIGTDPRSDGWAARSTRGAAQPINYNRVITHNEVRLFNRSAGRYEPWLTDVSLPKTPKGLCVEFKGVGRDGKRASIVFNTPTSRGKGFVEVDMLRKIAPNEHCNQETGRVDVAVSQFDDSYDLAITPTHFIRSSGTILRQGPSLKFGYVEAGKINNGDCVQILKEYKNRWAKVAVASGGEQRTGYMRTSPVIIGKIGSDHTGCEQAS